MKGGEQAFKTSEVVRKVFAGRLPRRSGGGRGWGRGWGRGRALAAPVAFPLPLSCLACGVSASYLWGETCRRAVICAQPSARMRWVPSGLGWGRGWAAQDPKYRAVGLGVLRKGPNPPQESTKPSLFQHPQAMVSPAQRTGCLQQVWGHPSSAQQRNDPNNHRPAGHRAASRGETSDTGLVCSDS